MAVDLVKLRKKAGELAVKGKLDKALQAYQEIVQHDPKDIKTWVKIGDLYKQLSRGEQAIEIYSKAAKSYAVSGFLMQAISVSKMILEIDPNHGETQTALASLYAQKEGKAGDSGGATGQSATGAATAKGAGASVLEMLKKKGGGSVAMPPPAAKPATPEAKPAAPAAPAVKPMAPPAPPAPPPPPAPRIAEVVTEEVEEIETYEEADTEEAATDTPASGSSGGFPQFDALDLDMADDLFDQIMKQDVVEIATTADAEKILSALPNIPLFSSLEVEEFMGIVEKINLCRFDVGDKIIKEGEQGTSFYIIAAGAAKITKTNADGEEKRIASLSEGDFFGEFSFFAESVRAANVTVTKEMEALEIDRDELTALIKEFPRIEEVMREFYKERLIGTMLGISPFFKPLTDDDRAAVLERFEIIETKTGDVLIKQGTEGQGLFVIANGEISVTVKGQDGNVFEVARLHQGEFFGEISLITDKVTTANCISVKRGLVFKLPRDAFKSLISEYPQILEITADFAEKRVRSTKAAMIKGGTDKLTKAGIV